MSWDKNPYYSPEKFGLEPVCEIDYSSGCYEFDIRIVWYHPESGKYYTARDSGCSCPSPFENYNYLSDIPEYSFNMILEEAQEEASSSGYEGKDIGYFVGKLPRI